MKRFTLRSTKGQTALEYFMMLTFLIIPLAFTVRSLLSDSKEGAQDNLPRQVIKESYGDGSRMGIIGRPYP